jgi:hypothetical protein
MLVRYKIVTQKFCLPLCGEDSNSLYLSIMHTLLKTMEILQNSRGKKQILVSGYLKENVDVVPRAIPPFFNGVSSDAVPCPPTLRFIYLLISTIT